MLYNGQGGCVHSAWASFSYYTAAAALMGPNESSLPRRITLKGDHHLRTRSIQTCGNQSDVVIADECVNEGKVSLDFRKTFSFHVPLQVKLLLVLQIDRDISNCASTELVLDLHP